MACFWLWVRVPNRFSYWVSASKGVHDMIIFAPSNPKVSQFTPEGGYVIHKVRCIPGSVCRFSVWFGADGTPYDAERFSEGVRQNLNHNPTPKQWAWIRDNLRIEG